QAHVLILESNYDETMLNNGPYPAYLKERIKSNKGHLSNDQAAAYLAQTPHPQLQHVFLAHLSDHNNKPETALKTLNNALVAANGIGNNFQATAFDRKKRSKLFVIND
ncbi:MAG TPA: MBL fold metallo-hydrolase, partial [Bacteroidales bacterium]|nr:MBL fold metallo-hydrolase [Bacteroidales bacterium]